MNLRPPYRYVDPVVEARLSLYADDRGFVQITVGHATDPARVMAVRLRDEALDGLINELTAARAAITGSRADGTADPFDAFDAIAADLTDDEREGFRLQQLHNKGFGHYLSTACYHGEHGYCAAMTGYQGEKRPATCKFCDARCVCPCHREESRG